MWVLLLQAFSLWSLWRARYRTATAVIAASGAFLALITYAPISALLIKPLEQSMLRAQLPAKVDGIIVLGGVAWIEHGEARLSGEAERLNAFIALARQYPEAKLVFTGGNASADQPPEADAVRLFLLHQGFDTNNVMFESAARNTYENARFSQQLVHPGASENWILITSASHMPRAHSVFRKIGWNVLPYPVAYRSAGDARPISAEENYRTLKIAIREWLAIAVYRWAGYI